jgi:quinoprotein dehydrogenase-associated probable ABC transporter substrate-binding protein
VLQLAAAAQPTVEAMPPAGPGGAAEPPTTVAKDVLRVCADPNNLPQSNSRGEGYENQLAQVLARDLGRKLQYTFFPQRLGFVRNTLRARDDVTLQYKCDLIMGVPKGYELTATTQPYMRSIYALVHTGRSGFPQFASAEDLLKLPPDRLHALRIGLFAQTPAADWVLKNGLIDRAVLYPAQSGDPAETAASIVERDLQQGKIDAAILWGPIAGFLANQHAASGTSGSWKSVPFKPDPAIKLDYEISMGVRNGEKEWQQTLDSWISSHRGEIAQILSSHHVPLLPP